MMPSKGDKIRTRLTEKQETKLFHGFLIPGLLSPV